MVCRSKRPRVDLLRLTVDHLSGEVLLNVQTSGSKAVHGRSVYLCPQKSCIEQALKGNRLKGALVGGRGRKEKPRRAIKWPLESSLIHTLTTTCTER
jgi:predicted RNA-binding protein YlxR (DUF448 family)